MSNSGIKLMQGGVDRLPFSDFLTPEEALRTLESVMHPEKFPLWSEPFLKEYKTWYQALLMVRTRFEFYLFEALPQPDLYSRIGSRGRELRLMFAAHRCIVKAEEIRSELGHMVDKYLAKCSRHSECKLRGIEPISAKPMGYSLSPCERTGICVCTHRGSVPPYMDGCNGDTTLLLPFHEGTSQPYFPQHVTRGCGCLPDTGG
ncbi:MAG: hypothetical protein HGB34_04670 [Candidatus Moranbacteria bacterium]|nr:hypothetical protein [Candidatus Moranbacteria bacterium]